MNLRMVIDITANGLLVAIDTSADLEYNNEERDTKSKSSIKQNLMY